MSGVRLGGFVIHGNNADTLPACLRSLQAVCDEVVALDSGSTDGSAALARQAQVRTADHVWEGYGNARARAAALLEGCDYLLFLDADERFADGAAEALRGWKADGPRLPYFKVLLHDWAELPARRFRFRSLHVYRLYRRDAAAWRREMIVHESVPKRFGPGPTLPGVEIHHRFATSVERRVEKEERYALLWAVQAHAREARAKPAAAQTVAHLARNALIKGALWRGGADGWALSRTAARYHARKYTALRALQRGAHPELVTLYREGRLEALFRRVDALTVGAKRP